MSMTEHYDALEELNKHIPLREKLSAPTNLSVKYFFVIVVIVGIIFACYIRLINEGY